MSTRYTRSVLAAAVVTCAFAGWGSGAAIAKDSRMSVTAIGCLQGEREYRRQHESSKFAGTGHGLNDEYVLIDAVIGGPDLNIEPITEQQAASCVTGQGAGQAFELTGSGEDRSNLSSFLGRRVVIRGMLKHTKFDTGPVGTSGTFTPLGTNGGPSLGSDLKLREINVESASLVPIRAIPEAAPVIHGAEEPAPAPVPAPVAEAPAPPAPAPIAPASPAAPAPLPKTASPLPAIGLVGLMSLALGVGLRLFNRRPRVV
jgi:hypothetical protein